MKAEPRKKAKAQPEPKARPVETEAKAPEVIEIDLEEEIRPRKVARVAKDPKPRVEPKAKPKAEAKSEQEPKAKASQKSAVKEEQQGDGPTAEEVLATIPDAVLPEVDESAKFNFRQLQERKEAAQLQVGGESIELNEAQPYCLSGLTIVFTGTLPRLDRDALENLAKRYGAKVTKSISGKTNLVVIGEEAGPLKVKKIKSLKIKAIDEDGFIQLINSMPAEGGGLKQAELARQKREEEERRIVEEAEREEREEKKAAQQAQHTKSAGAQPSKPVSNNDKLWTQKYAPSSISQLCGNKGKIQQLRAWLENWFDNQKRGFKDSGDGGFRAVLISGPPGIGKTSAAHLVAHELGYDVLEKNASDVRSKSLLNSNIKSVLNNTSVVGFFNDNHSANNRKFCLIMDEVDGMLSGDHGGAGALSAFCRITSMPLILICNDRLLPKMRTFDRVTLNLAFRRPTEQEVRLRLMTIALREHIKLDPTIIGQLVQATHNDIRQMINLLATVSKTQKVIGHEQSKDIAKAWQKHTILKPFDITARLFSAQTHLPNGLSLNDKINLYFNDIDFTPLMIQENYLFTEPSGATSAANHLERVANAADDLSLSDTVNSLIRSSEQQWSLLPFHAVMSSVRPSAAVCGRMKQQINFASWLGQNSKALKYQRLLQELHYHTRLRTSTDKTELRLDYVPALSVRLTRSLLQPEANIDEVIHIMDHYYLTREDWDLMLDLGVGKAKGDLITKKIPTKVKSAFTRKYNSTSHPTAIYHTGNSFKGRAKADKPDFDDVVEDDTKDEPDEQDDDDDIKKDTLIKEVKPKKKAAPRKRAKKDK